MLNKLLVVDLKNPHMQLLKDNLGKHYDMDDVSNIEEADTYMLSMHRQIKLVMISIDLFRQKHYFIIDKMKRNIVLESIPVICIGEIYASETKKNEDEEDALKHGALNFFSPPFNYNIINMYIRNIIKFKENASFAKALMTKDDKLSDNKSLSDNIFASNSKSVNSVVMHTNIGAACILEYSGEALAIVKSNKKFSMELTGTNIPMETVLSDNLERHMDENNREILMNTLIKASDDNDEATCNLILRNLREDQPVMYICLAVKTIGQIGEKKLFYCIFENKTEIYESKRRESALAEQLNIIISNFGGGITASYFDNGNVNFIFFNDEFYSMFGYTREEFEKELDGNIFALLMPEDVARIKKSMQSSVTKMKGIEMEFRAKKRDGSIIWVRNRNSICYMDTIERTVNIIFYNDITLEKQTEERIKTINDRLGNSEIFLQLDITNRTIDEYHSQYEPGMNVSKLRKYNLTYDDLFESAVYHIDKQKAFDMLSYRALLEHYKKGDTKIFVEYRRHMPSGEIRWFAATGILIEGIAANTVNALIYSHDIDMRLKKRVAKNKIIDSDVDDITIIDISNATADVVKLNNGNSIDCGLTDYYMNILNYINNNVAEEDRESCRLFFKLDNLVSIVNKCGKADISFWLNTKGGSNRRKNVRITYLDSTHENLLMVGRDITELFEREKERQMALQQAAQLADYANQAKSEYLTRMSHDMRTPLDSILGLTELAKRENCSEELKEYLNGIDSSGQYLLGLINDTLDLSKIESGKMELNEESYTIEEFVRGVNTVIKPLMDAKNIEFVLGLDK